MIVKPKTNLAESKTSANKTARIFKFAINKTVINKVAKEDKKGFKRLSANYKDTEGTIYDLQENIKQGYATAAGLFDGKWRSKGNVVGSQVVMGDLDSNLTIQDAIAHPFVNQYCSLIYTTASHTPESHRFRVVFVLPQVVSKEVVEVLVRKLMKLLPEADPSCKDASRAFYGNTNAEFPLVNPSAVLPQEWINNAIAEAAEEELDRQRRLEESRKRAQELREQFNEQDYDKLILTALDFIPPRQPGSGNYSECITVLMALNSHFGSTEAEIIAERWSPSIKGNTWNIPRKIRSFRGRDGVSIVSLFYIAKQHGFKFPKNENWKPQSYNQDGELEPTVTKDQWNGIREHQKTQSSLKELAALGGKLIKCLVQEVKGFGEKKAKNVRKAVKVVDANPKNAITYKDNDGLMNAIAKATKLVQEGKYKVVLIRSYTGAGKNYAVGQIFKNNLHLGFGVDRAIFAATDYLTPSDINIRDYGVILPGRNDGRYADQNDLVHGKPRIRNPRDGETPNSPGNCYFAALHNLAASKNLPILKEGNKSNPICQSCSAFAVCAGFTAPTSAGQPSYIHDRKRALASDKLRASINSLYFLAQEDTKDITMLLIDEFSQQCQPTTVIEATASQIQETIDKLRNHFPHAASQIRLGHEVLLKQHQKHLTDARRINDELAEALDLAYRQQNLFTTRLDPKVQQGINTLRDKRKAALNQASKAYKTYKTRVYADAQALQELQDLSEGIEEKTAWLYKLLGIVNGDAAKALKAVNPQLSNQKRHNGYSRDEIDKLISLDPQIIAGITALVDGLENSIVREVEAIAKGHGDKFDKSVDTLKLIKNLLPNWLQPILRINSGMIEGSYLVQKGKLEIHLVNEDLRSLVLKEGHVSILMDATMNLIELAGTLGISVDEILVIEKEKPEVSKLKIIQLTGMGLINKDISDNKKSRMAAIANHLKTQFGDDVGFIAPKAIKQSSWGHWFKDNRGSNEYQNKGNLCLFGSPVSNIGAICARYEALEGVIVNDIEVDTGLQQRIASLAQSEVIQAVGRTRCFRRTNENLTVYVVAEGDLSYLADYFPGCTITSQDVFELCPEAGAKGQQSLNNLFKAFGELAQSGQKVTQSAIAKITGQSQQYISKLTRELGGFRPLKKILLSLYNSLIGKVVKNQDAVFNEIEKTLTPDELETLAAVKAVMTSNSEAGVADEVSVEDVTMLLDEAEMVKPLIAAVRYCPSEAFKTKYMTKLLVKILFQHMEIPSELLAIA